VDAALVVVVRSVWRPLLMMGEHARNMYSISNSYNKYIQQVHQVGFSFIH
jgi:hypothetical protein